MLLFRFSKIGLVLFAIITLCNSRSFAVDSSMFYHPADSTIYFITGGIRWWDDDSYFIYIFRLKDEAHRIERTRDLANERYSVGWPLSHDNISGRLYSGYNGQRVVSENGGDNWHLTG